jgi:hemoglobin-like flavoprotein
MPPTPRHLLYDVDEWRLTDHALLTESLGVVAPFGDDVAAAFYRALLVARPDLRGRLPRDMSDQRGKFLHALVILAGYVDQPEWLITALPAMGLRPDCIGTQLGDFTVVGEVLIDVLRRFSGADWQDEYEHAWQRVYAFAVGIMLATGVSAGFDTPNQPAARSDRQMPTSGPLPVPILA